ncbi:hypothetical protein A2U01_0033288, partial [Trifolium medium]|nr:hypothetical protein [Trifolium medium]
ARYDAQEPVLAAALCAGARVSEANIQARVKEGFSWEDSRVGETF